MVKYILRRAFESEAGQIKRLINLVGINPTGLDWRRFIVTVDVGGHIIGCGQIKPHGREIQELASIAVLPEYRGQGIARAIIGRLLSDGPRPLYLMCMSHNGPLYERFGFETLTPEQMPRYFQRIYRLFSIADVIRHAEEQLLVMKLG